MEKRLFPISLSLLLPLFLWLLFPLPASAQTVPGEILVGLAPDVRDHRPLSHYFFPPRNLLHLDAPAKTRLQRARRGHDSDRIEHDRRCRADGAALLAG